MGRQPSPTEGKSVQGRPSSPSVRRQPSVRRMPQSGRTDRVSLRFPDVVHANKADKDLKTCDICSDCGQAMKALARQCAYT